VLLASHEVQWLNRLWTGTPLHSGTGGTWLNWERTPTRL